MSMAMERLDKVVLPVHNNVRRRDIYMADLGVTVGSEQNGVRPVLVISNNLCNKFADVVIVAIISSQVEGKKSLPTHVFLSAKECGLDRDSFVGLEQIKTISKHRLGWRITTLNKDVMEKVNQAIDISVGDD